MAWNNGFPATYGQMYPQGYPIPQAPAYGPQMPNPGFQQPMQQAQQQAPQMSQDMTPTIRVEMKQTDSIEAINRVPMAAGTTGAFMTKDEAHIVFRTMYQNGEHSDEIYDRRPPAPPAPKFDPADYVRKDQLDMLVSASIASQLAAARTQEKEEA